MGENSTCDHGNFEVVGSSTFVVGLAWFLIVGTSSSAIVLLVLFFRRRSRYAILRERCPILVLSMVVGALLQLGWAVDSVMQREGFPCRIMYNLLLTVVTMQMGPRVISMISFYYKIRLNQKLSKFELIAAVALARDDRLENVKLSLIAPKLTALVPDELEPIQRARSIKSRLMCCFTSQVCYTEKKSQVISAVLQHIDPMKSTDDVCDKFKDFPSDYLFLLSSAKFGVGLQSLLILITLLVGLLNTRSTEDCLSPCSSTDNYPTTQISVLTVILVTIAIYLLTKIKDEPDPLKIRRELVYAAANGGIMGTLTGVLTSIMPGTIDEEGEFRWVFFWVFGSWIEILIVLGLPVYFSYEQDCTRKKHQLSTLTLKQVLKSEAGRNRFKAFLVGEFSLENYLFWTEANLYRSKFAENGSAENNRIRGLMIDLYVRQDSNLQVNVSWQAREACIESLSHPPSITDFDLPLKDVFRNMSEDSFSRFRKTVAFHELGGGHDI